MNGAELCVALAHELAWPLVAIIAIIFLKSSDIDFAGLGITARVSRKRERKKYRLNERRVETLFLPGSKQGKPEKSSSNRDSRIQQTYLEAYERLSAAVLLKLGESSSVDFDDAIRGALADNRIDSEFSEALDSLQHMYRIVMFAPDRTVSREDALEYEKLVDEAIGRLPT